MADSVVYSRNKQSLFGNCFRCDRFPGVTTYTLERDSLHYPRHRIVNWLFVLYGASSTLPPSEARTARELEIFFENHPSSEALYL